MLTEHSSLLSPFFESHLPIAAELLLIFQPFRACCISPTSSPIWPLAQLLAFSLPTMSTMGVCSSDLSSDVGPLLPDYTFLSHCIYHSLSRPSRSRSTSSSSSSSSSSPSSHRIPALSLDVSSLVASFLWSPHITASTNQLSARTRFLRNHPTLPYCTGETHGDTHQHDCWTDDLRQRILRGWRLRAIHGWGGLYANGLGFTYGPSIGGDGNAEGDGGNGLLEVEAVYGTHHNPELTHFELEAGERIVQVSVICSVWMQALRFTTSHGRQYQLGRGEHQRYYQPLLPTADQLHGRQVEVLALMFGVGGHIHNIGVRYLLLSPTATDRKYASVQQLVAMIGVDGVAWHEADGESSNSLTSASDARPGSRWQRQFQLGRVKRQRRTGRPQQQNDNDSDD